MGKLSKLSRNKRTERQKQKIAMQPAITERNRRFRHKKHIRLYPKDAQAIKAMAKRGIVAG